MNPNVCSSIRGDNGSIAITSPRHVPALARDKCTARRAPHSADFALHVVGLPAPTPIPVATVARGMRVTVAA
jgi:hypothetical protein